MIGKTIGHFRIDGLLGEGGMGKVYLATDLKLDRKLALKMLPAELADDRDRLRRFEREAKAIAALNHPAIVTIYSIEDIDEKLFIAMEYVEGESLRKEVLPTGLPAERLLEIGTTLCGALGAAHAAKIWHRDVKPENVMATPDGALKLLDFGIAKLPAGDELSETEDLLTRRGQILGTRPYMSPEQIDGRPVAAKSDLFSLGVMLYELAVGERPFKGDTATQVIGSILHAQPRKVSELRPDLPKALDTVLDRCLAKNPEDRIESAAELSTALEEALGDGSIGRSLRSPLGYVVAAAALATALGAGYWLSPGRDSKPEPSSTPADHPRVVVLPFESLGAGTDPLFAEGVTEEVTSQLTRLDGVEVISRFTARIFGEQGVNVRDVSAQLDLDYLLSGSVRSEGEAGTGRLRVTPLLIDTESDVEVWSESFEPLVGSLIASQVEVAEAVAEAIGVELRERSRGGPSEPLPLEAVMARLRARSLIRDGIASVDELQTAVAEIEMAADASPEDPVVWAELALLGIEGWRSGLDQSEEARQRTIDALIRANEIDPGDPEVLRAVARYNRWIEEDGALEAYESLLARAPLDLEALTFSAQSSLDAGDPAAALPDLETALRLDPYNAGVAALLVQALSAAQETDRLAATCEQLQAHSFVTNLEPPPACVALDAP